LKILLLNAPPRAGKDEAAAAIVTAFQNLANVGFGFSYTVGHHKMAESLKAGAHALFGMNEPAEFFEQNKDTPLPQLLGKTPREIYIWLSERCVKPEFGKQTFGNIFVNRLRAAERMSDAATAREYLCVCSDLGFEEETAPLIEAYGADNILIMHIVRPGFTFEAGKDSRSYLRPAGVEISTIPNNSSIEHLRLVCTNVAYDWLRQKAPLNHAQTSTSA